MYILRCFKVFRNGTVCFCYLKYSKARVKTWTDIVVTVTMLCRWVKTSTNKTGYRKKQKIRLNWLWWYKKNTHTLTKTLKMRNWCKTSGYKKVSKSELKQEWKKTSPQVNLRILWQPWKMYNTDLIQSFGVLAWMKSQRLSQWVQILFSHPRLQLWEPRIRAQPIFPTHLHK